MLTAALGFAAAFALIFSRVPIAVALLLIATIPEISLDTHVMEESGSGKPAAIDR